ncbi:hypothetical protein L345_10473, partial [Ophiophagus hannah]
MVTCDGCWLRSTQIPLFLTLSFPSPRCNSEIKYSSEKHFRDAIFYHPRPTITTYQESVTVAPNCTWRNYKSQLLFEPRQKPLRYQSTTIIFPKRAKNLYRTTLNYRLGCAKRWFASSVQLALCEDNNAYLTPPENFNRSTSWRHVPWLKASQRRPQGYNFFLADSIVGHASVFHTSRTSLAREPPPKM